MNRIKRDFFDRHPKYVAPELLGKYLVTLTDSGKIVTKIVETEAYGGEKDRACHAGRFGYNKRTAPLFGKTGYSYIYPVNINVFCLNVVCHEPGEAGGVLIRALEPIEGINLILRNLNKGGESYKIERLLNGPGKLCKALKIDSHLNSEDMVEGDRVFFLLGERIEKDKISSTYRINIPYAGISKYWKWRFIIKDSKFLSRIN